jgi:phage-related protein
MGTNPLGLGIELGPSDKMKIKKPIETLILSIRKLNTRVLWFFVKGRRIIAVHGIRNKGHAIPARDLDTARERMSDWKERNEP